MGAWSKAEIVRYTLSMTATPFNEAMHGSCSRVECSH